jgi:flagellar protein FlbD
MIELTRLNGSPLVVNSEMIQYAEASPDTTLTLVNGEKVVVSETPGQVIDLAIRYRARIMGEAARHAPGSLVLASGAMPRAVPEDKGNGPREEIEGGINYVARRRAVQD